jgi:hypothetical protein
MGRMIRKKIAGSDAPSTRPASISSSGIVSMYCRMKKMPKAFAAHGTISGQGVSIQWKVLRIITNSGTMITANGIASVEMTNANRKLRPGNLNFANP